MIIAEGWFRDEKKSSLDYFCSISGPRDFQSVRGRPADIWKKDEIDRVSVASLKS